MKQFRNSPACRAERGAGRKFACPLPQQNRREIQVFSMALALALLALALGVEAQGAGTVYRIGILPTQVNGGAPCEPRSPSGC
jgi:hypothetical protein